MRPALRPRVRLTLALVIVVVASGPAAAAPAHRTVRPSFAAGPRAATTGYVPPVAPPVVVRPFDPPDGPYGPGHRGVDLAARAGAEIVAAAAGTVTFAGAVAGRGVVVVAHADGIRTEYEPVHPSVHAGDVVARGQPIGDVTGTHHGCAEACLHWGARRGDAYLDPMTLLRPLGPVRLLPWP